MPRQHKPTTSLPAPVAQAQVARPGRAAVLLVPLTFVATACSLLGLGRPTATPIPVPTVPALPPSATPLPPDVLYNDSFTDPASGWTTVTTGTTKSGYHPPDAFHLEVSAPNLPFWIFREQDFGDFSAELQVFADNAGDDGQWRHGLALRQSAEGSFYAFLINPRAQTWQVLKRAGDSWQSLAEGSNPNIGTELKAVNTLRVDALGPNMTFAVNGQGVVALSDAEFPAGDVGFVVETFTQTLAHVHFDSLLVRLYDPNTVPLAPAAVPTPTASPTPSGTPTPTATFALGGQSQSQTALALTAISLGTTIPLGTIPAIPTIPPILGTIAPPLGTIVCGIPGVPCP